MHINYLIMKHNALSVKTEIGSEKEISTAIYTKILKISSVGSSNLRNG